MTIKVYNFDELNEKAKEKAIEEYSEGSFLDYDWWDFLDLNELLPDRVAKHFTNKSNVARAINGEKPITKLFDWEDFYFDFERGRYIIFQHLVIKDIMLFRKWLKIPLRLWNKIDGNWEIYNGNEQTTTIQFEEEYGNNFTEKDKTIIERAKNIFDDLMEKALKMLKDEYNYLCSREAIIDNIQNNDYKFTEDGRRCLYA